MIHSCGDDMFSVFSKRKNLTIHEVSRILGSNHRLFRAGRSKTMTVPMRLIRSMSCVSLSCC
jgi:hypothetical protein